MEAASLAEYEAGLSEYPHQLAANRANYEAKIFGWKARNLKDQQITGAVIATGTSLPTSYASGGFKGMGGSGGSTNGGSVPSSYGMGVPTRP